MEYNMQSTSHYSYTSISWQWKIVSMAEDKNKEHNQQENCDKEHGDILEA
jgi:hypothetical protein